MKLTRVERLILANQCKILEALYPKEAETYVWHREVLERGFAGFYDDIATRITADSDTLSAEQCSEVVSILTMFYYLQVSYDRLTDKTGIDPELMEFSGFDGNSEGSRRAYAKFFCKLDGGRFPKLRASRDFNSHFPALGTYQRMLAAYDRVMQGEFHVLSKEEILSVIRAGYPHS